MATTIVAKMINDETAERIRRASGDVELRFAASEEEFEAALPDAEIVVGELQPAQFARAGQARWLAYLSAGINHLMTPAILQSDVIITCAKGFVGIHLAEHAFALLLGLTRDVALVTRNRSWTDNPLVARELIGSTMGIIGLGGAGRETAKRAHAFGMRVLAVDPTPAEVPDHVEACWGMDRFHDLLEVCDVIVICAPLTPDTEEMFNTEAFGHMKSDALLINVSRGRIVEEEALVRALQQGQIGGAGLDVLPVEPVPDDHPLWQMDNVVITPHSAGASAMRMVRWTDTFSENLNCYLAGEEVVLSRFDKGLGY
jgi:phosphoglycerate dehydrogenase-like enzyme